MANTTAKPIVLLTNAPGFPAAWTAGGGEAGRTVRATSLLDMVRNAGQSDLLLVYNDSTLLYGLSAIFTALPFLRRPLLGCDILLRKPESLRSKLTLPFKRFLLSRVDHFLLVPKDLSGYQRYFGIGPSRGTFVPYKPNIRYQYDVKPDADGEYVLCFGRSLRDFDTFFDAVERLPYPAAITRPDFAQLRMHGSRFTRSLQQLPKQVRLLEDEPGNAGVVKALTDAKLVVVPLLKSCLVMAGSPLNAMLLGKCVILTDGPAVKGIFTDEVLAVPPEDPVALAAAIDRAWQDQELREKTAAAGYRYAVSLGGEPELIERLIDATVSWLSMHRVKGRAST